MRNQTSQVMDTPAARPAEPGKHGPLVQRSFGRISALQKWSGLCQEVVGPFTKVCEPRPQTAWREGVCLGSQWLGGGIGLLSPFLVFPRVLEVLWSLCRLL